MTHRIRTQIHALPVDNGTKAGILAVYKNSGIVKTPDDLRHLSEEERAWFQSGFEDYLEDHNHPIRSLHAPHHFGRILYYLSLVYYLSLTIWLSTIISVSLRTVTVINWPSVWGWIVFASSFNVALTFYGIYLEIKAYRHQITTMHRVMAALAIIVLIVAIMGNMISPFGGSADTITPFLREL